MTRILAVAAALMLSGTIMTAAQRYCDGSEGAGTNRNAVTGSGCPIGQPGWASPPITDPTVGQAPATDPRNTPDRKDRPKSKSPTNNNSNNQE